MPAAAAATAFVGAGFGFELVRTIARLMAVPIVLKTVVPKLEKIDYDWLVEAITGERPPVMVPEIEKGRRFIRMIRDINVEQVVWSAYAGAIDPWIGRIVRDIYGAYIWSLGLGWLSWVALSPFLGEAVAEPLREHYRRKFRTVKPTRTMIEDYLRTKLIDRAKASAELARLGYSDQWIDIILSRTQLKAKDKPRDKLWAMAIDTFLLGGIASAKFEEIGFLLEKPNLEIREWIELESRIKNLAKTKEKIEVLERYRESSVKRLVKEVVQAWYEDALTEAEFRDFMFTLGMTELEIGIAKKLKDPWKRVKAARERLERKTETLIPEARRLLTALIRAYTEGALPQAKFIEELKKLGLTDEEIKFLLPLRELERMIEQHRESLKTRKQALTPEARKLLTALIKAYREGALPIDQFRTKALELGLTEQDIKFLIPLREIEQLIEKHRELKKGKQEEIEEWNIKEFKRALIRSLIRYYKEGFLSPAQLGRELEGLGLSPPMIELLKRRADLEYQYDYYRDLAKATTEAFEKGVITLEQLRALLARWIVRTERLDAIVSYEDYKILPRPEVKIFR